MFGGKALGYIAGTLIWMPCVLGMCWANIPSKTGLDAMLHGVAVICDMCGPWRVGMGLRECREGLRPHFQGSTVHLARLWEITSWRARLMVCKQNSPLDLCERAI